MNSHADFSFLRNYGAEPVGFTPPQPLLAEADPDSPAKCTVELDHEMAAADWKAVIVGEAPAQLDEYPVRFIDGSIYSLPVLCLKAPAGWPIPILMVEVGAVALRLDGRRFTRTFALVERLLSFVADPFPWAEVESFAATICNDSGLEARLVTANLPSAKGDPPVPPNCFDYELMRQQAFHRCEQDMLNAERLALAADPNVPTLVDGKLAGRIGERAAQARPLVVGIVKRTAPDLHPEGWRVLLDLRPGQRTPVFKLTGKVKEKLADMPTASWFLKLAGGPRLAPNWGFVRVDVPWVQFPEVDRFGFVNRLSRWLIDARCRTESYARMPVSLDPIVRAEEAIKPLFSPLPLLVNRIYRRAGLFRRTEP